jgi:hypothetical protein
MASRYLLASPVLLLAIACSGKSKPPVTSGDGDGPACEPGRCLDDISRAVSEKKPAARTCYEQGKARTPTIEGLLVINFTIDPEGAVTETSQGMQDNQISDQGVIDCVSELIKTVRFGKSAAGKTTRAYHRFEFAR